MPVIAIVNRKGGSGKSTLATHLAAHCANAGLPVMLGDVDPQQSTQSWLRLRQAHIGASRPPILGWTVEPARGLRPPAGTTHVVLDTPGGLTGFDLARVVMFADAVLMPVCNSVFDRESAAQGLAELRALPKVVSGRCRVAAVGMRVDADPASLRRLRSWCVGLELPLVGTLRDTPAYVRCVEQGLTLFDMPSRQVHTDLQQWRSILQWLAPLLEPGPVGDAAARDLPTALATRRAVAQVAAQATTPSQPPRPVVTGMGELLKGWLRRAPRPADAAGLHR